MSERTHYSRRPIPRLWGVEQFPSSTRKPEGFWYGIDGDWDRWVRDEEMGWTDGDRWLYALTLGEANVLRIPTDLGLAHFHHRYKGTPEYMKKPDWKWQVGTDIDWLRVAADYDGIEIAPYLWTYRHDDTVRWYYSWDAASGCLWRPHETSSITLVREAVPA